MAAARHPFSAYNQSMTVTDDTLKKDILSALGTAQFLEADSGLPAAALLRQSLTQLFEDRFGADAGKEALNAILPEQPEAADLQAPAGAGAADLFAWFEDLDRRFQQQDPAFEPPTAAFCSESGPPWGR